ncbi:Protein of unknown function [Pyronema omphalodes CBS 100304]|uniref:Uncharacterized protein n=1 Tax=Pyronema omphalodes (strain CBS 100304) TaxID=1076935 RepID=U4LG53_PYROM|nr:Protein of unknown function [Pyronema omphalodes CBS 100304]
MLQPKFKLQAKKRTLYLCQAIFLTWTKILMSISVVLIAAMVIVFAVIMVDMARLKLRQRKLMREN